jgi:DNA end-binding protein Ku
MATSGGHTVANAIWKGNISFGLLNVPVTLYSAENNTDIHFRMLDSRNHQRVRYERVNEETGEEVPWNEIVKGYEYDKGSYVVIDPEELKSLMPEATQTVDLETFVRSEDVDPMYFEKPYYLVPQKKYEKGYVLLRESLKESGTVGIAHVVIRTRGYLAAVLPHENALVLNLIRYPQEIRAQAEFNIPQGKAADYNVSDRELQMSRMLIESMTSDWNPGEFHDEYRESLLEFINEKVKVAQGRREEVAEAGEAVEPVEATNVVDMMEVLKRSLAQKKEPAETEKSRAKAGTRSGAKPSTKVGKAGEKARRKSS